MVFVDKLKLEVPSEFPVAEFIEFSVRADAKLLRPKAEAWREFASANNLIAWRFRAVFEALDRYRMSWDRFGDHAGFEELYHRQHALFDLFTSGVSCLEAMSYAIYALASHPAVLGIPFGDVEQRRCNPASLRRAMSGRPTAASLEAALGRLVESSEWSLWTDLRNRMNHRSTLPRALSITVGPSVPALTSKAVQFAGTSSTPPFAADMSEMRDHYLWLAKTLRECLSGAAGLASSQ